MSASQRESLGYPNGFDAGDSTWDRPVSRWAKPRRGDPVPAPDARSGAHRIDRQSLQPGNDILPPRSAAILARASRSRPQHSRYVICRYGNAFGMSSPSARTSIAGQPPDRSRVSPGIGTRAGATRGRRLPGQGREEAIRQKLGVSGSAAGKLRIGVSPDVRQGILHRLGSCSRVKGLTIRAPTSSGKCSIGRARPPHLAGSLRLHCARDTGPSDGAPG